MTSSKASFSYAQAAKGLVADTPQMNDPSSSNTTATAISGDAVTNGDLHATGDLDSEQRDRLVHSTHAADLPNDAAKTIHTADSFVVEGTSSKPGDATGRQSAQTVPPADDTRREISKDNPTASQNGQNSHAGGSSSPSVATQQTPSEADGEMSNSILLHEAPVPAVNVWKKRAEERAATLPVMPRAAPTAQVNGHHNPHVQMPDRSNITKNGRAENGRKYDVPALPRHNQERGSLPKRSVDRAVETIGGRKLSASYQLPPSKEGVFKTAPLPPTRDQASWPTPETAEKDDKKRVGEKVDKTEKTEKVEKAEDDTSDKKKSHGKKDWVSIPFTPTVVFNTPLPSTSRRGGKPGTRGGREGSTRALNTAVGNTSVSPETATVAASHAPGSAPSEHRQDQASSTTRSRSPRDDGIFSASEGRAASSAPTEHGETPHLPVNRTGPLTNGYHHPRGGLRSTRGRRGDMYAGSERRRENGDDTFSTSTTLSRYSESRHAAGFSNPNESAGHTRRAKSISEETFSSTKQHVPFVPGGHRRERGDARPRGGARGGRGGHSNYGHIVPPSPSQQTNGPGGAPSPFGFAQARSPSSWHSEQNGVHASQQGPHAQQTRSYRGPPNRVQSLPNDQSYNRYVNPYGASPTVPSYPGYQTFDIPAPPIPQNVPYGLYNEQQSLLAMVSSQVEYYFSVDNLCKDMFLRKNMDSQGFVPMALIASFNRIQRLTTELDTIRLICYQSPNIDWVVADDGTDLLRASRDWEMWVLSNKDEREPRARNDGPADPKPAMMPAPTMFEHHTHQRMHSISHLPPNGIPAPPLWPGLNGSQPPYSPTSHADTPLSPLNNMSHLGFVNGFATGRGAEADVVSGGYPQAHVDPEADSFSDAQAGGLTVFVRGRTDLREQEHYVNGNATTSEDRPDHSTSNGTHVPSDGTDRSAIAQTFWVKDNDKPVDSLPSASECERYYVLRATALAERDAAPSGQSPHNLSVLYGFWAHFLVRNFNNNMYQEFHRLALDDHHVRLVDVGYQALLSYYRDALSNDSFIIRETVARDYVALVAEELMSTADTDGSESKEKSAFKQLRTQWRDGATSLRNRKKIGSFLDDNTRALLDSSNR